MTSISLDAYGCAHYCLLVLLHSSHSKGNSLKQAQMNLLHISMMQVFKSDIVRCLHSMILTIFIGIRIDLLSRESLKDINSEIFRIFYYVLSQPDTEFTYNMYYVFFTNI